MSSYRLADSFCIKSPLPMLVFGIVIAIIIPPIPFIIAFQAEIDRTVLLASALVMLPFLLLFTSFLAGRTYFRTRGLLRGFRIYLERDALTRTAPGLADLTLFRDEIVEIVETPGLGVAVFPRDRWSNILVPAALVGYEEVRRELSRWKEISVRPRYAFLQGALAIGLGILILAAWFLAFVPGMPYLAVPCGVTATSALMYFIWVVQRSPHFDRRTKWLVWGLLLSILPIVLKITMDLGLILMP
jgi:hypothetical protein